LPVLGVRALAARSERVELLELELAVLPKRPKAIETSRPAVESV
jgi:hypothetical protein